MFLAGDVEIILHLIPIFPISIGAGINFKFPNQFFKMDKSFPLSGFGSAALHAGHKKDPLYAHVTPIYASSTFVYDEAEQGMRRFSGEEDGYIYSRWGNPNFTEAEDKIAALEAFGLRDENGKPLQLKAFLHASGMAALTTLMIGNLKKGDKILTHYSLYSGLEEMITKILPQFGVE